MTGAVATPIAMKNTITTTIPKLTDEDSPIAETTTITKWAEITTAIAAIIITTAIAVITIVAQIATPQEAIEVLIEIKKH